MPSSFSISYIARLHMYLDTAVYKLLNKKNKKQKTKKLILAWIRDIDA